MMDRHQAGFNRMSRLSAREAIEWQTGALAVSFGHWLASLTVPWGRSQFLNVVVLALFDCVTYGLSCQLPACLVQPDCCYQPFYEVIGAPEDLDGWMILRRFWPV